MFVITASILNYNMGDSPLLFFNLSLFIIEKWTKLLHTIKVTFQIINDFMKKCVLKKTINFVSNVKCLT